MKRLLHAVLYLFLVGIHLLHFGCAAKIEHKPETTRLVVAEQTIAGDDSVPAFQVFAWDRAYNRIGKVTAQGENTHYTVSVDPQESVIYTGEFSFNTDKATYANRVYRIHFPKIPFSLIPFHLAYGKNPGLLILVTVDDDNKPVLVTTVHTCGCYIAVIPTSNLPFSAYPLNWPEETQDIFGETLPARLQMESEDSQIVVSIRPEVHRIMDVRVVEKVSLEGQVVHAQMESLASLKDLDLPDGTTASMYYRKWPLRSHVRGAIKPWESLLLSLPSLDFYVGMDKEYGSTKESGNPFYTSLKPWNRSASDLNDFAGFLRFYGWNL